MPKTVIVSCDPQSKKNECDKGTTIECKSYVEIINQMFNKRYKGFCGPKPKK